MSLEICKNQLICLIDDGSTSVWSIKEIDNFPFCHPCVEQRIDYFEDDWGFRWKLLEEMKNTIHLLLHQTSILYTHIVDNIHTLCRDRGKTI